MNQRSRFWRSLTIVAAALSWLFLGAALIVVAAIVALVHFGPSGGRGGSSNVIYSAETKNVWLDPSDGLPSISITWYGEKSATTQPQFVNRFVFQNGQGFATFRISDQKLPRQTPEGLFTFNNRVWQIQTNLLLFFAPLFLLVTFLVSWARWSVNGVIVGTLRLIHSLWVPSARKLKLIRRDERGFPVELHDR